MAERSARRRQRALHGRRLAFCEPDALILRTDEARMRANIKSDLIETFSPVLNDLLRSIECGEVY